jgi:hypothetical protein
MFLSWPLWDNKGAQHWAGTISRNQQEVDLLSLFKDVANEYAHMASVPAQLRHLVDRGVRIAKAERTVTCIIIPNDLHGDGRSFCAATRAWDNPFRCWSSKCPCWSVGGISMSERLSLMSASNARESAEQFAGKVKEIRENLGHMASELENRVQDALKPILRSHHPLTIVGLGGLSFFLVGSAIGFAMRKRRKEATLLEKGRRLRRAVVRIVEDPDRMVPPAPSIGRDMFGVACSVIAATLARKLIDRAF